MADIQIKYDGELPIATAGNRYSKDWKNSTMQWSALLKEISKTTRTRETLEEYARMTKPKQDGIKDIGGFVGGHLKNGRRQTENVVSRQLVTLDADSGPAGIAAELEYQIPGAYAVYSTHKHRPEAPRLRILIPLTREVSPEEHEAIARKIADRIGIDFFDETAYRAAQMMYWPSTAKDGEYVFDYQDVPWTNPDEVLAEYRDWKDVSYWPVSKREKERRQKSVESRQKDPLEKDGVIGAFNRTYYPIQTAINTFLSDVYEECAIPGRYTYKQGSTAAGVVIYDDKFAYSNHATDPASGQLCSAFDLVRVHKFRELDEDVKPDTPVNKMPSYLAMLEFASSDTATKRVLFREQFANDGGNSDDEDTDQETNGNVEDPKDYDWLVKADPVTKKNGALVNCLKNLLIILQNDPALKGFVLNQLADNIEIKDGVPWDTEKRFWRDADDAQLEAYLSRFAEFPKNKIMSMLTKVADDRKYHPIREYLASLPEWDGTPRADTLLVDFLGAEDNVYVRAVTRKTLCAAIKRVMHPGCKFDTILVLCGPQGIGKSTLVHKLGKEWFTDSLNLTDTRDKTAAEKLQGRWIVEIGELAGIRSAGIKTLRSFISTQDDMYRAAYDRRASSHPRQCIMIGTTNSMEGYLNDTDGGRRFWPVNTPGYGDYDPWDLSDTDVDQVWAEAMVYYKAGESLVLSGEAQTIAEQMQRNAVISEPVSGMVERYLDVLLPEDWYDHDLEYRTRWFSSSELHKDGTMRRDRVSYQEIWCECYQKPLISMQIADTYAIRRIMMKLEDWQYADRLPRDRAYGGKQMRGYSRVKR